METLETLKQEISTLADARQGEFEKVSSYIFENPELAFK